MVQSDTEMYYWGARIFNDIGKWREGQRYSGGSVGSLCPPSETGSVERVCEENQTHVAEVGASSFAEGDI